MKDIVGVLKQKLFGRRAELERANAQRRQARALNDQRRRIIVELREKMAKLQQRSEARRIAIAQLRARLDAVSERNKVLTAKTRRLEAKLKQFEPSSGGAFDDRYATGVTFTRWRNQGVNNYLNFANYASQIADELASDAYMAHGVAALPAAKLLRDEKGGRLLFDCIEFPSFTKLAVPTRLLPSNTTMLDYATLGYLADCDRVLTVGWSLGREIEGHGPPVSVIPNYRYAEPLESSDWLREQCGVGADDVLVLSLSTVATGMEAVVEALADLGPRFHLAQVGPLVRQDYSDKIDDLAKSLGVCERFHRFDLLPYEDLTAIASGADVGLIVRDPAILNNYISLPNRVFDLLASGVPFCAPYMPDIAKVLTERQAGAVVDPMDRAGWAAAIRSVAERGEDAKRAARAAAEAMTWEAVEDELAEAFGDISSLTIFGVKNLSRNNRTLRIARTLIARGIDIKICTTSPGPIDEGLPGRYFILPQQTTSF